MGKPAYIILECTLTLILETKSKIIYVLVYLTLSVLTLWNTSPVRGGADLPTPLIWLSVFSIFFLNRDLVLDVKDQNPKPQPSTLKIEASRIFRKIDIFGENPKKLKIRYLEIRCLIRKRSARALNGPIGPIFLDRSKHKPQT